MARWRTLHEIAAVCFLLREHGDELTGRYVAHQIVETRKAASQYQRYHERLGRDAFSNSELADIEKRYNDALNKYGRDFKNDYGWAAEHLNKKKPTFADIQEKLKIDHLAPYYRMRLSVTGSHGVRMRRSFLSL